MLKDVGGSTRMGGQFWDEVDGNRAARKSVNSLCARRCHKPNVVRC